MMLKRKLEELAAKELKRIQKAAQEKVAAVVQDPRVHEVRENAKMRAQEMRDGVLEKADQRLEYLIESKHGNVLSPEAQTALAGRRRARDEQASQRGARQFVLSQAQNAAERRVLQRVLEVTTWAGGTQDEEIRYTQLLDLLAPSGEAAQEMSIHRAVWSLAERYVLSVSAHGVVTACPPSQPMMFED